MSAPRDHHFIPAFFLKQWTGRGGKLIEYTIKQRKLVAKAVGPRSTGFETDLYALTDLPPELVQYVEQVFWDYADRGAAQALDIQLGLIPAAWDAELRTDWSRFVIGVHMRHPDVMSELREAVRDIWDTPDPDTQAKYERIKTPNDPSILEDYVAKLDPSIPAKVRMNLIIKAFDNEEIGQRLNEMKWFVLDLSASRHTLLLSDRPVQLTDLRKDDGIVALAVSPTKLFVAVNKTAIGTASEQRLRKAKPKEVVTAYNAFAVSRARRFVWTRDSSQEGFIGKHMSTAMEPTPFFPTFSRTEAAVTKAV